MKAPEAVVGHQLKVLVVDDNAVESVCYCIVGAGQACEAGVGLDAWSSVHSKIAAGGWEAG